MRPLFSVMSLLVTVAAAVMGENPERILSSSSIPRGKLSIVATSGRIPYEIFLPTMPTADNKHGAPVLVFLHGRGESGSFDVTNEQSLPLQLLANTSFAMLCPFIVIVPQCPESCMFENGWMDSVLEDTTSIVAEVVDTYNGDKSRVYLAGQSMGGNGAWLYASQQKSLFAAVLVVCGYALPSDVAKVTGRLRRSGTAVAVVHSADDSVIPVSASDVVVESLRSLGHADLKYWRYAHAPGPPMPEYSHLIGHGSYEIAFRDQAVYEWLLQHSCLKCDPRATKWIPLHL